MALYQHSTQPQLYQGDLFGTGCNGLFFVVPYVPPANSTTKNSMSCKPDPPNKSTSNRPLHFVNTDARSLGPRDAGKRTRDVKSHLSGHYRRWKKQQTLAAQVAKVQHHEPKSSPGTSTPASSASSAISPNSEPARTTASCITSRTSKRTHSRSSVSLTPQCGQSESSLNESPSPDDDNPQCSPWKAATPISLQDSLSYGNSDPFFSLPLPVDPITNMHIQLFHEGTTVMCWTRTVDQKLRDLVQHEALMHGVLAISKVIASVYLPGDRATPELRPESRHHYGQLLRLMRIYFKDSSKIDSEIAFEMMHAAMMFCFLIRDYDEFEFHLRSLKLRIDALGGIKAISKSHSSRFLNAERVRGIFLIKKPLTPIESWAPGPWAQQDNLRPYDRLYEEGRLLNSTKIRPQVPEGPFSRKVTTLIIDHRDMLAAGTTAARLSRSKRPGVEAITGWLGFRSHSLTMRTAEVVSDITEALDQTSTTQQSSTPSASDLDLNLHAAASLAANFTAHLIHFSMNPTVGLSYVPFHQLTSRLRTISSLTKSGSSLLPHENLYLWTLFVGACAELASRTWSCYPDFRGQSWCSANLARMLVRLDIDTFDRFKDTLRQFILPFMFDGYLRVLFERRFELMELAE